MCLRLLFIHSATRDQFSGINRDFAIERSDVDMLAKLFEGGHWQPHVDPRGPFNLDQVGQAFTLSKTGTVVGKIAIVP